TRRSMPGQKGCHSCAVGSDAASRSTTMRVSSMPGYLQDPGTQCPRNSVWRRAQPDGSVRPTTLRFRSAGPSSCFFGVAAAGIRVAVPAAAQVVEPNGISVPRVVANGEITLGQYFASRGEAIDPVAAASVSPGVFSPLCGFEASLVLSQSGALAG